MLMVSTIIRGIGNQKYLKVVIGNIFQKTVLFTEPHLMVGEVPEPPISIDSLYLAVPPTRGRYS